MRRKALFAIGRKIKGVRVGVRTATLIYARKDHICSLCQFRILINTEYWSSPPLKICRRHVPDRRWYERP